MARKIRIVQPVILLTVIFGIFIIGYWFMVLPQFKLLSQALTDLNADSSPVTSSKSGVAAERAKQVSELKDLTEKLMPTEDKQYDLAVQIENVAKNSGVTITAFTLNAVQPDLPKTSAAAADDGDTAAKKTPAAATLAPAATAAPVVSKLVTISLGISGTYGNVQNFVGQLTSIDRFIQVTQASLSSTASASAGTTGATNDQVSSTITAQAYYLPLK